MNIKGQLIRILNLLSIPFIISVHYVGISFKVEVAWLISQINQCHHHNGDQAARQPEILCLICIHSFGGFCESCMTVRGINAEPDKKAHQLVG